MRAVVVMPTDRSTSGFQPRLADRLRRQALHDRLVRRGVDELDQVVRVAVVQVAGHLGDLHHRDGEVVAADVEGALGLLDHEAGGAHGVADPTPRPLRPTMHDDRGAVLRLPQHVDDRCAAPACREARPVRHREPQDREAVGTVQAAGVLAPPLRQAVHVVRQRERPVVLVAQLVAVVAVHLGRRRVHEAAPKIAARLRDERRHPGVVDDRLGRVVLAEQAADLRREVHHDVGLGLLDDALRDAGHPQVVVASGAADLEDRRRRRGGRSRPARARATCR